MKLEKGLKQGVVAGLAFTLAAGPAFAGSVPSNLADLAYQDANWAASQLRSRGYHLQSSDRHNGSEWQYWWNGGSNICVAIVVNDGKVNDTNRSSSTDCGQYHSEATKDDKNAAIALGAAALIGGIVALAHQSHQRDGKHGEDAKSVSEFDRGYRDGLHREDYHNYNDTPAYSDGFSAGVKQRGEETGYRSGQSRESGYTSHVNVNDLVGARASSADSELRSRGFGDAGGYKRGDSSHVLWWNGRTRQCFDVVTENGRVDSIEAVVEGNCQ